MGRLYRSCQESAAVQEAQTSGPTKNHQNLLKKNDAQIGAMYGNVFRKSPNIWVFLHVRIPAAFGGPAVLDGQVARSPELVGHGL